MGEAGTAYIEDSSGALTFAHKDIATLSPTNPIVLGSIYVGAENKWIINYNESIRKILADPSNELDSRLYAMGYRYCCTDNDGTEVYFHRSHKIDENGEETSDYEIVDETGKGIVLTQVGASVKLTYPDGTITEFWAYCDQEINFNLSKKTDVYGNYIVCGYYDSPDSLNPVMYSNNDDDNVFLYYTGTNLTSISSYNYTDSGNETVSFAYNSANQITQITRTDGKKSFFEYSGTRLTKVLDEKTGYCVVFGYNSMGRVTSVKEYTETPNSMVIDNATPGQGMEMTYDNYSTTFRTYGTDGILDNSANSDDILTVYQFDNYGRTISAYSKSYAGNEFYGAEMQEYTSGGMLLRPRA